MPREFCERHTYTRSGNEGSLDGQRGRGSDIRSQGEMTALWERHPAQAGMNPHGRISFAELAVTNKKK